MIAIGKDQLGDAVGETATCPVCGQQHEVKYGETIGKDGTRTPSKMLGFVKCGNGHLYLVSIKGRIIKD